MSENAPQFFGYFFCAQLEISNFDLNAMFLVCNDAMTHEKKVKNVLLAVRLQYVTGKAPSLNVVFTKSYLLGKKWNCDS